MLRSVGTRTYRAGFPSPLLCGDHGHHGRECGCWYCCWCPCLFLYPLLHWCVVGVAVQEGDDGQRVQV
jgi:hypothetical protein